jgi:hypothetical protein
LVHNPGARYHSTETEWRELAFEGGCGGTDAAFLDHLTVPIQETKLEASVAKIYATKTVVSLNTPVPPVFGTEDSRVRKLKVSPDTGITLSEDTGVLISSPWSDRQDRQFAAVQ